MKGYTAANFSCDIMKAVNGLFFCLKQVGFKSLSLRQNLIQWKTEKCNGISDGFPDNKF